jgi:hypothetical protein
MFKTALKKIAQALHSGKIPYMIIGGRAVLQYLGRVFRFRRIYVPNKARVVSLYKY